MNEKERRCKQSKWARWRWEFTRDNPEYREAYKDVLKLREKAWVSPELKNLAGYPYLQTEEGKKEKKIAKKFGLIGNCMIDPQKSFDDLMEGPDCMEKNNFFPATFWEHFLEFEIDLENQNLTLKIELSKVNSFKALKVELNKFLDLLLNDLFSRKMRVYFRPGGRELRQSKDYYDYLLTGRKYMELKRQKTRVTFKDLARELYPQYNQDPEGYRKKVEKAFHEYERLIQGDYREITYP